MTEDEWERHQEVLDWARTLSTEELAHLYAEITLMLEFRRGYVRKILTLPGFNDDEEEKE